jgi:hypothetical protein
MVVSRQMQRDRLTKIIRPIQPSRHNYPPIAIEALAKHPVTIRRWRAKLQGVAVSKVSSGCASLSGQAELRFIESVCLDRFQSSTRTAVINNFG